MKFKPYEDSDESILRLTNIASKWDFWRAPEVFKSLKNPHCKLFHEVDWKALVFYQVTGESADLLYVYVDPEFRNDGLGHRILQYGNDTLAKMEVDKLLLEVSTQNEFAKKLYKKLGANRIETKKSYYQNGDDADIYKIAFK